MKSETKAVRIDQKKIFFIYLFFFSKNLGYKETKNTNFLKEIT